MSTSTTRMERLYARALQLYPRAFRDAYAETMRRALRDALEDGELPPGLLARTLAKDMALSLIKEHCAMVNGSQQSVVFYLGRPAVAFNALILAGIATVLAIALYAIPQQVLRQGANDPQIQLAGDLVARLESGVAPDLAVGSADIDMARSLTPFVIVYDDAGKPLASQARLNGEVPSPPNGVFDTVRQHGEERVSWQPVLGSERGVRIAAVVQRVGGKHSGFVLAGRSMREVEARELQVRNMAGLAWLGMLGLILLGTVSFAWFSRRQVPPSSAHGDKAALA